MSNEKLAVALSSVVASAALTIIKAGVGIVTGSLAVWSEAAHSLLDFAATLMTYFAVRVAERPADDTHPYGHGKVESLAALMETGLLIALSGVVAYEAIDRLSTDATPVNLPWWALGLLVFTIIVDVWRARALHKVAKQTNSQALEADALHFSSDALSTIIVLVGLGFVMAGFPKADSLAALVVAGFIAVAALRLGKRTVDTLIDAAPDGALAHVRELAGKVSGVVEVSRVRVRPVGNILFVDATVSVPRTLPSSRVDEIRETIKQDILAQFPEAEPNVVTETVSLAQETVMERVHFIAQRMGLAVHHVTVQMIDEGISVGLDLEVDGQMPLSEAHITASRLEEAIHAELGEAIEVETHIEPLLVDGIFGQPASADILATIKQQLANAAQGCTGLSDIHNVRARQTTQGLYITFHCRANPSRLVEDVHEEISRLESGLRKQNASVRRIIAHAEPVK